MGNSLPYTGIFLGPKRQGFPTLTLLKVSGKLKARTHSPFDRTKASSRRAWHCPPLLSHKPEEFLISIT